MSMRSELENLVIASKNIGYMECCGVYNTEKEKQLNELMEKFLQKYEKKMENER